MGVIVFLTIGRSVIIRNVIVQILAEACTMEVTDGAAHGTKPINTADVLRELPGELLCSHQSVSLYPSQGHRKEQWSPGEDLASTLPFISEAASSAVGGREPSWQQNTKGLDHSLLLNNTNR